MPKQDEIMVGIQYRDKLSVGENRKRLGYGAFHWSIMIRTISQYHRFDVTDGIVQDPKTLENINPNEDWIYRHLTSRTVTEITRYLGAVVIGELQSSSDLDAIEALLQNLKRPDKDERPHQNCVSWTVEAVQLLQSNNFCSTFEIDQLKDFVLQHADDRILQYATTSDIVRLPAAFPAKQRHRRSMLSKICPVS